MNIVFLGDSVTQGCFEILKNNAGEWELIIEPEYSYVSLIEQKFKSDYPDRDIKIINSGISGDSTKEALDRIDKDVLAYEPDIVSVCLGLNNSGRRNLKEFSDQLSEIYARIKPTGAATVFMTPNMLNTRVDPETADFLVEMAKDCTVLQSEGEMDRLIDTAIRVSKENGAAICDVYSVWKKLEFYGIDTTGLLCNHINHPTREMHRLFADKLYDILKEMI